MLIRRFIFTNLRQGRFREIDVDSSSIIMLIATFSPFWLNKIINGENNYQISKPSNSTVKALFADLIYNKSQKNAVKKFYESC